MNTYTKPAVSANYAVLSVITQIQGQISRTDRMTRTNLRVYAQLLNVALGTVMETEWTIDKDVVKAIYETWALITSCDTTELVYRDPEYAHLYAEDDLSGTPHASDLEDARATFYDIVYAGIRESGDLDTSRVFNPNIHHKDDTY